MQVMWLKALRKSGTAAEKGVHNLLLFLTVANHDL